MTLPSTPAEERLALTRRVQARSPDGRLSMPEPITQYSSLYAWVLLGDPGAGKTDTFQMLSEAEGGKYVSARNFVELDQSLDKDALVFIDGLDEISAGNALGYTALGQIRTKLQKLGTPRFRISCREADWRGSTDSAALRDLVSGQNFMELHLASLSRQESEALIAHWQQPGTQTPADFIKEAEHRDLEGLLDNPQTLRMLVEATKDGWPKTKTQTYELACARLVQEHNEQWLALTREGAFPDEELLEAAGYLCSLMLLAGGGSLAIQKAAKPASNIIALPDLPATASAPDIARCRTVLHTRLFRGTSSGEFVPVHRTVAEYLAAKYLAKRVREGLPPKRAMALMLGDDAGVVPELRGLHAWLAAAATGNLRAELIDRDPLGVILNGDVRSFTHTEKLRILEALNNEARRYTYFRSQNWVSQPFGALATADMEEDFRKRLTSDDRSPAHLALVDCILDAIAHGQPMPALQAEIEHVVRDATYWQGSRVEALKVLNSYAQQDGNWTTAKRLLADINTGTVQDSEDELVANLLKVLYPRQMSASDLLTHLRRPKSSRLIGAYWQFWNDLPKESTSIEEISELLDVLVARKYRLDSQDDETGIARVIGSLLVRGVTELGDSLNTAHLYRWLLLGLGEHYYSPLDSEHKEALKNWLEAHTDQYKELFKYGVLLQSELTKSGWNVIWQTQHQLYEAAEPDDADKLYISLAEFVTQDDLRKQLVIAAFRFIEKRTDPNSALEWLEEWRNSHSSNAWVDILLATPYPPDDQYDERVESKSKRQEQKQDREKQKLDFLSKKLPSFAGDNPDFGALVEIGNAYLNLFRKSRKETGEARLEEFLNHNLEWKELALNGLRQCLFRKDLPIYEEIIKLNIAGRHYNIGVPCMAAMDLRWTEDPTTALSLPDPTLETVAAFRLTSNYDTTPVWFRQLIATRPRTLGGVMIALINAQIETKKEYIAGVYSLAHDESYAEVAKLTVPAVLASFPSKANKQQLESLRLLIVSMMKNLDSGIQSQIITEKLQNEKTDVAQRVYWFTAGLQFAPDIYLEPARQYITCTEARVSHLIAFVHEQRRRDTSRITLPVAALKFLIEVLGPRCNPKWPNQSGWVTPDMELGRYVEGLLSALASTHEEAAIEALNSLLHNKALHQWEDSLRRAIFEQRLTRRKALFKPATVAQVASTLADLKPANTADLWALTLHHLQQLGREIRHGNTNDYRQYWNGENREVEDNCRDRLLSDLKIRLSPLDINAEPEGRYADEKRADIKVSAEGYNIPIEIKQDRNPGLWKAIANQLVAKYTREAASDGYGIFLVFWFGGAGQRVAGDGGSKPKTAEELQSRLQQTVAEELQHKIAVLVIDCSQRPKGKT